MSKKTNITLSGQILYIKKGKDKAATMLKVDRFKHPTLYWFLRDNGQRMADEFDRKKIRTYPIETVEDWAKIGNETGNRNGSLQKFSIWAASNFECFEIAPPVPVVNPLAIKKEA